MVVEISTVYVHSGYLKEHQSEDGLAVTDWLPLGCFAVPVSRSVANGSTVVIGLLIAADSFAAAAVAW